MKHLKTKYRILTNGINFKAQIKSCWLWCTLQDMYDDDVIYKSYEDAEKDIIRYIDGLDEENNYWVVKSI